MKHRLFLVAMLLLAGLSLFAQPSEKWKIVRDKETKKYGYKETKRASEWIIAPEYDKAKKFSLGVAIVKNDKMFGLIDEYGKQVLPCEYSSIAVDKRNLLVHGCRYLLVGGDALNADDVVDLWGVYSLAGKEIIPPFYEDKFSFNSRGLSAARYGPTGLYGIMSKDGRTVVPSEFLAMKKDIGEFVGLDKYFLTKRFDSYGVLSSEETLLSPGYVKPYETGGDDVKAVVYHRMFIGERMHKNNLVGIDNPYASYVVGHGRLLLTSIWDVADGGEYAVNWGYLEDRFVRLLLEECDGDVPHAMYYEPTGKYYTIMAELCEPWGERLSVVSEYGWIDAVCNEGMIYSAQGDQLWFFSGDVNMPARLRWFDITGYLKGRAPTIQSAFDFGREDTNLLRSWRRCRDLKYGIYLAENAGIQSFYPPVVPSSSVSSVERLESRIPALTCLFGLGDVFRGKLEEAEGEGNVVFRAEPELTVPFVDVYEDVGMENAREELLYWGSDNRRYIKLDLLPHSIRRSDYSDSKSAPFLWDDVISSSYGYAIAVNLYESDGAFVRTLGISEHITCCEKDIIVLGDLGLAFTFYIPDSKGKIYFKAPKESPNTLSALKRFTQD